MASYPGQWQIPSVGQPATVQNMSPPAPYMSPSAQTTSPPQQVMSPMQQIMSPVPQNMSIMPQNMMLAQQQRPQLQHSYTAPAALQQPMVQGGYPGFNNASAAHHTTTTTSTTTTSTHMSNVGSYHGQQHTPSPMGQLADRMQSMQIQQPPPQQQVYQPVQQFQQAPVYSPPPPQPPPSAPPALPAPLRQRAPTLPAPVSNQNSKSPVSVEQRQSAYQLWLSQNPGKPQKTRDRTIAQYLSGQLDQQIYQMLVTQQQTQQVQTTIQTQQISNALQTQQVAEQRRAQRDSARQQRNQEREQKKAEEERWQRQRSHSQQQLMRPPMHGGFVGMHNTTTTTATTETTQMIMQQGVDAGAGENRRKAIAEGEASVRKLNDRVQEALSELDICPAGFEWVPVSDGYMCCGGTHFIPDKEIDKLLDSQWYEPRIDRVNCPKAIHPFLPVFMPNFDGSVEMETLKKPPEQLPKRALCWLVYWHAKGMKDYFESGRTGGQWDYNMFKDG